MKIYTLLTLLFFATVSNAQLPSEKPLDEIYSTAVKQKLQPVKSSKATNEDLPSNAALPKQATIAKTKTVTKAITNGQEIRRQRSGDPDNLLPPIHPPKKHRNNKTAIQFNRKRMIN